MPENESSSSKNALITGIFVLSAACITGAFLLLNTAFEKGFTVGMTSNQEPTAQVASDKPTVSPNSDVSNSVLTNANKSCQEFGGTPIELSAITNTQIQNWRSIGKTDRSAVGRVIYCEIHQVSGFVPFVEGDTISQNTVITADLGFNWNTQYPNSLERLVHSGGGWGVFLTLKPIVVQHANDLNTDVGGQYWYVLP